MNSEKRGQAKYCVRNYADVFTDFLDTFESVFVFIKPRAEAQGLGFGHLRHRRNAVDPHPSLRATLSHKEREKNKWRCDPNRRFVPRRCDWVMKRLFVALKSAL